MDSQIPFDTISSNDGTDAANDIEIDLNETVTIEAPDDDQDLEDQYDDGSDEESSEGECLSAQVEEGLFKATKVTKKGKNYVWTYTSKDSQSLAPFGIQRDTWGKDNRDWVKDPSNDKAKVLRINYPKGTSTPSSKWNPPKVKGGSGFYAAPIPSSIIARAKFVTFQYDVFFPKNFDYKRGGKLPGLYGGNGQKMGCSGGNSASDCFSARFMWRAKAAGEAYLYIPKNADQDAGLKKVPPVTHLDPKYGSSVGRGAFRFKQGGWTTIKQLVKVNTVGKKDGILKIWANGKLVISFGKMVWRNNDKINLQGVAFETFFGGSSKDCVAGKDEYTLFRNYELIAAY